MKSLPKILLALIAVAALSVACPAKANLITNGGFETGDFTGWSAGFSTVTGTLDGIAPHSGNYQAHLLGFIIVPPNMTQTLATTPGQSYTVDLWAASPGGADFNVVWGGSTVFSHVFGAGLTGYTEFTFNVTASSASTALEIWGHGAFLDDISVNAVGAGVPDGGSTVSLLGCALFGLAGLRRKLGC